MHVFILGKSAIYYNAYCNCDSTDMIFAFAAHIINLISPPV